MFLKRVETNLKALQQGEDRLRYCLERPYESICYLNHDIERALEAIVHGVCSRDGHPVLG